MNSQDNTSLNNNAHTSNEYLISLPTHNQERQKHSNMRNYQPIPTRVTRTARKPRISRGKLNRNNYWTRSDNFLQQHERICKSKKGTSKQSNKSHFRIYPKWKDLEWFNHYY